MFRTHIEPNRTKPLSQQKNPNRTEPTVFVLAKNSNRTPIFCRTRTEPNPSSEGSFPSLVLISTDVDKTQMCFSHLEQFLTKKWRGREIYNVTRQYRFLSVTSNTTALNCQSFSSKKLQVWADEQTYTNDIVQVETDKHSITVNKKLHLKSVFSTNRLPQLQK